MELHAARVLDIALKPFDNLSQKLSKNGHGALGSIQYEFIEGDNIGGPLYAKPAQSNLKDYPLINEIVLIIKTVGTNIYTSRGKQISYYISNLNIWGGSPNHNALPRQGEINPDGSGTTEGNQIPTIRLGIGEFIERNDIKTLLPFEGDRIFEGRFGNSIRMGATTPDILNSWSRPNKKSKFGDPITIISNGLPVHNPNLNEHEKESLYKDNSLWGDPKDRPNKPWISTVEDINHDPSSIWLTSTQQIKNFKAKGYYDKKAESFHPSMLALTDEDENKTLNQKNTESTNYIQFPGLKDTPLPDSFEETPDIYLPPTPDLQEEHLLTSELANLNEDDFLPYYMVEGETDTNLILNNENISDSIPNESATTHLNTEATELDLSMGIGNYYLLHHLISTPKSSDINYISPLLSTYHANALFERDLIGFYTETNAIGWKKILTKEYLGPTGSAFTGAIDIETAANYRVLSDTPQITPLSSVAPWQYTKNDTALIREAESQVFGNYSSYGINNYPGVDKDINQEEIINNLVILFENCIDHIKAEFPTLRLRSVYRSKNLNKVLGKNPPNSEHIYGYAADLRLGETGNNMGLFNFIYNNLEFKNLMWAFPERNENSWVHVSYIPNMNFKKTTLASESNYFHDIYKGNRRGNNNQYQDNITEALTPLYHQNVL